MIMCVHELTPVAERLSAVKLVNLSNTLNTHSDTNVKKREKYTHPNVYNTCTCKLYVRQEHYIHVIIILT